MGLGYNISPGFLVTDDTLPILVLHLLKVPQVSSRGPSSPGDQVSVQTHKSSFRESGLAWWEKHGESHSSIHCNVISPRTRKQKTGELIQTLVFKGSPLVLSPAKSHLPKGLLVYKVSPPVTHQATSSVCHFKSCLLPSLPINSTDIRAWKPRSSPCLKVCRTAFRRLCARRRPGELQPRGRAPPPCFAPPPPPDTMTGPEQRIRRASLAGPPWPPERRRAGAVQRDRWRAGADSG